jgi:hypothetical protein
MGARGWARGNQRTGQQEPEDGPKGARGWANRNQRMGQREPEGGGQHGTTDQGGKYYGPRGKG